MNLFTYGTLMFPEIWEAVVGPQIAAEATTDELSGYEIRRFDGYDFPGIYLGENATHPIPGIVYHDLDDETVARLDTYEDSAYFREEVTTKSGIACQTYIVRSTHRHLLSTEIWTPDWFDEHCRSAYFASHFG